MRCSVVCGVTLSLLVINISRLLPQSTLPLTTSDVSQLARRCRPWSTGDRVYNIWPVAALTQAESRFLPTTPAFDAPLGGFPSECCYAFGTEKLEWCGYSTVKNFWRYVYSFWHDPRTWRTHGHTDRQTHTAWRLKPRLHNIARQ